MPLAQRNVTIPPALKKRLRRLATEDADLLLEQRDMWEQHCLRGHYRRVWQKLCKQERELLKGQNPECLEHDLIRAIADHLHRPAVGPNPFDAFWQTASFGGSAQP